MLLLRFQMSRVYPILCCLCLLCANLVIAQEEDTSVSFDDVKPILKKRCTTCHGRNDPPSGLDLTTLQALNAGSESGPIVVAGKPEQSLLYTLSAHIEEPIMPPGKDRMPQAELEVIRDWIANGMSSGAASSVAQSAELKPITTVTPVSRPTAITAIAASPLGDLVAISGLRQVVMLRAETLEAIHAYPFPEGDVFDLEFSRDGKLLAVAGGKGAASGKVVVLEVATGKRVSESPEEFDVALSVALTKDSRFFAWGGPFREARILEIRTGKSRSFQGPTDWVLSVDVSPEGRLVAGADRFGGLRVWNTATGKVFWDLRGHTGAVTQVIWSDDGNRLMSVGVDETCRFWDLHSGKEIAKIELSCGQAWAADWDGDLCAVGGRSGQVVMMDPEGNRLGQCELTDEVSEVAFIPNERTLLASDSAGNIAKIEIGSGKVVRRFSLPIKEQLVKVELPWPMRSRPEPAKVVTTVSASPSESLANALRETEAAIQSTESNLKQLRETAKLLKAALDAMNVD